jgi:hypothetical protein
VLEYFLTHVHHAQLPWVAGALAVRVHSIATSLLHISTCFGDRCLSAVCTTWWDTSRHRLPGQQLPLRQSPTDSTALRAAGRATSSRYERVCVHVHAYLHRVDASIRMMHHPDAVGAWQPSGPWFALCCRAWCLYQVLFDVCTW